MSECPPEYLADRFSRPIAFNYLLTLDLTDYVPVAGFRGVSIGSILQVVTICITGLESCTVAYAERLFSGIRHENDLAFHYKDKFVLARMPMVADLTNTVAVGV